MSSRLQRQKDFQLHRLGASPMIKLSYISATCNINFISSASFRSGLVLLPWVALPLSISLYFYQLSKTSCYGRYLEQSIVSVATVQLLPHPPTFYSNIFSSQHITKLHYWRLHSASRRSVMWFCIKTVSVLDMMLKNKNNLIIWAHQSPSRNDYQKNYFHG